MSLSLALACISLSSASIKRHTSVVHCCSGVLAFGHINFICLPCSFLICCALCLFEMGRNKNRNDDRSRSDESRRRDGKKEKKKPKHEDAGMDMESPRHGDERAPKCAAHSSGADASTLPAPPNVSLGDVFALVQSLVTKVDKIDVLSDKMAELGINQVNTNTQLAGVESRLDGLDARVIKLEENKSMPASSSDVQREMPAAGDPNIHVPGAAHPHHVWGSKERGSSGSAFPPTPPAVSVSSFDRPGRPNVIVCHTQDGVLVAKEIVFCQGS